LENSQCFEEKGKLFGELNQR